MHSDEHFMRRALALAEQGRYSVSPNPMVGCVIVRDGQVIAEGWHRRAGEAHAETEALRNCSDPKRATMYVTLEPCAHHGRTPPCVDAVIAAGLQKVVIAMADPHEVVDGRGVAKLREAGIEVTLGLLEAEARRLNEVFLWSVTQKMPFVVLKAGMTVDGKLATVTRESRWITSQAAREASLKLREEHDAILVGGGTVAADNPRLTRRLGLGNAVAGWTRVVLDKDRVVPPHAHLLTDGGRTRHITEEVDLEQLLRDLYQEGIRSLLVEGGALVHAEFIRRRLWQKMVLFVAPMIVGGGEAPSIFSGEAVTRLTEAYRFRFDRAEFVGGDLMITAYP
ncbi:MAG TPA: bifunctional diaminohydroxyphosphoribosylaminopyrimidine deaminase/5-amino-6-(5-phosphoribosylamino)uracil reductase RibD [Thermoanaerobaculia bacterium]|nr:bifunctional diaminohydroxyphosphoribosylaminopyrimidine deaminase/5-amino-6-(5-phosphoribosylamino)uracil reductase RibD [Thermoanaerobaculia bacterium]